MRKQRVGGDTTLTELQLLMMLGKSVSAHAAINATNLHMRGDTAETLEPYRLYILAKLSVHADPILRPRNACCSVLLLLYQRPSANSAFSRPSMVERHTSCIGTCKGVRASSVRHCPLGDSHDQN